MWNADEMMALLCGLMTEHWRGKLKTTHICILQLLNGIHWNVNNEKIHIFHEILFAYFHFIFFLPPFDGTFYLLISILVLCSIGFRIFATFYLYRLNCFDSSQFTTTIGNRWQRRGRHKDFLMWRILRKMAKWKR